MKVVGIRTKDQAHSVSPSVQGKSLSDLSLSHSSHSITSTNAGAGKIASPGSVTVGEADLTSDLMVDVGEEHEPQSGQELASTEMSGPVISDSMMRGPQIGKGDHTICGPVVRGKITSDSDPINEKPTQTGCDSGHNKQTILDTEEREEEKFHSIYDRIATDLSDSEDSVAADDFIYVSDQSSES